jgi:hypothetical protein
MYGKLFGQFLYDQGVISKAQLRDALLQQDKINHPLGVLALEQDMLVPEQLRKLLALQKRSDKQLGLLAIEQGYLNAEQIDFLVNIQKRAHLFIGDILVRQGSVSPEVLQTQLTLFHEFNREIASRIKNRLKSLPASVLIEHILETTQAYVSRAICGKAKATDILSCHHPDLKDTCITAHLTLHVAACRVHISFGFSLDRREALSLCYCLTDRSIQGQNRVSSVIGEYADSLGYLVDNVLRRSGYPVTNSRMTMHTDTEPARNAMFCLRMSTTIGPFILFFNIIPLD